MADRREDKDMELSLKKYVKVAVALVSLLAYSAVAKEKSSSSSLCQNIQGPNDVVKCAAENHSEVQLSRARLDESALYIDIAKQNPNPEFETEGIDNKEGGFATEISFMHTFELGGKRGARAKVALAQKQYSKTELLKVKEDVIIQTVLDLYRLRQIAHELEAVRENISTFTKIRNQYKQLGRMNPEQDFSLSIFKIAAEENHLRINQLSDEKSQIITRLHFSTGSEFPITRNILPKRDIVWPSIEEEKLSGSAIEELNNGIQLARAEYDLEKSHSWPDLAMGPKIEFISGGESETKVGFALSVPLPIYQANGAGRAKAMSSIRRSELRAKLKKKQLKSSRTNLVKIYKSIVRLLGRSRKKSGISDRHGKLHSLLDRGIVPSSLIIELHREILEFYETLHEQELRAAEVLWKIYALDGRILKETLR